MQFSFRCRFAPCTNASLGFDSEIARTSHEQLHVRRLFCNRPNCSRGRIGFRYQRDLKVHERTYHEQGSILVPPRVRKVFDSHTLASEQQAIISYDGGSFSLDENVHSASHATTQQNVVKYKSLMSFSASRIEDALAAWGSSPLRSDGFALLLNGNLKSGLDVNLMHTFNHNSVVCCVSISPDDSLVATGCDKLVRVFAIRTGKEIFAFDTNQSNSSDENYVRAIQFSGNGDHLTAGSKDGYITVSQSSKQVQRCGDG